MTLTVFWEGRDDVKPLWPIWIFGLRTWLQW